MSKSILSAYEKDAIKSPQYFWTDINGFVPALFAYLDWIRGDYNNGNTQLA
jgi:hypothetical protein